MNRVKLTSLALLLIATGLVFAQDGEEETKECHRLTLYIKCNSQGIVDKDWGVEFDVIGPDGKKINDKPMKVSIPKGSRVSSAATRIATTTNLHAGEENPANGPASTEETPSDSPLGNKGAAHEKEDVKLKEGYKFANIKKTCKGKDTKHLEVHKWKKKKETSDRRDEDVAPIDRKAVTVVVGPVLQYPLPQPDNMVINLKDAYAEIIGIRLNLVGYQGGSSYLATFEQYYDGATPLNVITDDLAIWALTEGFQVTWNSATKITIDFDNSGTLVTGKGFGAWMEFSTSEDDGELYYIDFDLR